MTDRPSSGGDFPARGGTTEARTSIAARIYTVVSVLLAAAVVLQLYVAGSGVFTIANQLDKNKTYAPSAFNNSTDWAVHYYNAFLVALLILLLVAMAFIARKPAKTKWLTGLLVLLFAIQATLGFVPFVASVRALHVINAFLIFAVVLFLVYTNWSFGRRSQR